MYIYSQASGSAPSQQRQPKRNRERIYRADNPNGLYHRRDGYKRPARMNRQNLLRTIGIGGAPGRSGGSDCRFQAPTSLTLRRPQKLLLKQEALLNPPCRSCTGPHCCYILYCKNYIFRIPHFRGKVVAFFALSGIHFHALYIWDVHHFFFVLSAFFII